MANHMANVPVSKESVRAPGPLPTPVASSSGAPTMASLTAGVSLLRGDTGGRLGMMASLARKRSTFQPPNLGTLAEAMDTHSAQGQSGQGSGQSGQGSIGQSGQGTSGQSAQASSGQGTQSAQSGQVAHKTSSSTSSAVETGSLKAERGQRLNAHPTTTDSN